MLEEVDLTKRLGKKEYKNLMPALRNRLYALQKASWDARIPVAIIFEGWDAAGKGTSIQTLTARLDPRGFKLYPIRAARTYEQKRPWLWRFWLKLSGRGEWAIFDRSWYGRVLVERVEELTPEQEWRRAYQDIVDFERNIADDGCLIIKFWLHISKQEQKRRFKKLVQDPLTAWQVTAEDWEHHSKYEDYALAVEEMLARTATEWGPWTIVEATDRYHTHVKIFQTIISTLEERLAAMGALPPQPKEKPAVETETADKTEKAPAKTAKSKKAAASRKSKRKEHAAQPKPAQKKKRRSVVRRKPAKEETTPSVQASGQEEGGEPSAS
jgi:polyphosphate kinase 2 (PPK2 family)